MTNQARSVAQPAAVSFVANSRQHLRLLRLRNFRAWWNATLMTQRDPPENDHKNVRKGCYPPVN